MSTEGNNPTIAPMLRIVYGIIAIVVIAGASLFFLPDIMVPRWPWPIAPFNTRFLGGIYLVELTAVAITMISNRWAPARLVLPISFVFGTVVTLVSFAYLSRFDFGKWSTYAWFLLYLVAIIAFAYYLWYYRNAAPADLTPVPPVWRLYLLAQGAVYGLYGVGLLALPDAFSSFWPWKIDDFHARVYSAIFVGIAVGMLVLSRAGAPIEFFTMGITQVILAICSVGGALIVDLSAHRVDWSSPGTWLWIAGFGVLLVAGLAMINHALSRGLFRTTVTVAAA